VKKEKLSELLLLPTKGSSSSLTKFANSIHHRKTPLNEEKENKL
jgi:hypothetical protein